MLKMKFFLKVIDQSLKTYISILPVGIICVINNRNIVILITLNVINILLLFLCSEYTN